MTIKNEAIRQSIVSSSEEYIAQIIDSIEFEHGKLNDSEKSKLSSDLFAWLEQSASNFSQSA